MDWNLFALNVDHKFNASREMNVRVFGLDAYRYSLGFVPKRPGSPDDNRERDLIKGDFQNWGTEVRFLNRYSLGSVPGVLLVGSRYYEGFNESTQGLGSSGRGADFNFINQEDYINYDYQFPNRNFAAFLENIFFLHDKFSITPGFRFERISTVADGFYGNRLQDNAGNIYFTSTKVEYRHNTRQFILSGLGLSYKPSVHSEIYGNVSQNYRSITFSDMRIISPSAEIDPSLEDERGFSIDVGARSDQTASYSYDVSLFYLDYNNRIGEIRTYDSLNFEKRIRTNVGHAVVYGIESYAEADVLALLKPTTSKLNAVVFTNLALITSQYKSSEVAANYRLAVQDQVQGKKVEFVPELNIKTGVRFGYEQFRASFQYTYLSEQFTDATNSRQEDQSSGIFGIIPQYDIMDVSLSYQFKRLKIEGSINNVANNMYFTRRATGYPGPGILASDGRSFFVTLQARI